MKYKILDLFCGAGGAAMGYYRAGFEVTGIDNKPQRHFPFSFVLADALEYCSEHGAEFDAIHASPPCQGYSIMLNLPWMKGRIYPKLIPAIRALLIMTGKPYVIENVAGSRYRETLKEGLQANMLCGQMFGLPIFRHRYFETNFPWFSLEHPKHQGYIKHSHTLGARAREIFVKRNSQRYGFDRPESAVGHARAIDGMSASQALGVEWMNRDEATQSVPPDYTEYIGKYLKIAVNDKTGVKKRDCGD